MSIFVINTTSSVLKWFSIHKGLFNTRVKIISRMFGRVAKHVLIIATPNSYKGGPYLTHRLISFFERQTPKKGVSWRETQQPDGQYASRSVSLNDTKFTISTSVIRLGHTISLDKTARQPTRIAVPSFPEDPKSWEKSRVWTIRKLKRQFAH